MAMVLYEGKSIAFGSCDEIFARVRAPAGAAAQATVQHAKPARRAVATERA
jgi:hypothetical protein